MSDTSEIFNFKIAGELVHTAGLLNENQLESLGERGYAAVVNLLPAETEYAIANEQAIVESQGIAYHYIPVDFAAPAESDYRQFARVLSGLPGHKVMVHCAANYRVSAFYSIYAFHHLGWSEAEAREFIGAIWNLGDYPVWEAFVEQNLRTAGN